MNIAENGSAGAEARAPAEAREGRTAVRLRPLRARRRRRPRERHDPRAHRRRRDRRSTAPSAGAPAPTGPTTSTASCDSGPDAPKRYKQPLLRADPADGRRASRVHADGARRTSATPLSSDVHFDDVAVPLEQPSSAAGGVEPGLAHARGPRPRRREDRDHAPSPSASPRRPSRKPGSTRRSASSSASRSVEIYIPGVTSLKEKRGIVKPLVARIRKEFNVSVVESEDHDQFGHTILAVAAVSASPDYLHGQLQRGAEAVGPGGWMRSWWITRSRCCSRPGDPPMCARVHLLCRRTVVYSRSCTEQ